MNEDAQITALQNAIIQRAHELAEEHVNQGKMTRNRILQDIRDKVQLMEKRSCSRPRRMQKGNTSAWYRPANYICSRNWTETAGVWCSR